MRLIALPSLISSLIVLVFGVYVYFKNPENRLNRIYGVFSLIIFYWIFAEFMFRNTLSFSVAALWIKIGLSAAGWIGPMFLHFALLFSGKDFFKNKFIIILFYIPSVIITVIYSLTNLAIGPPVFIAPFGWQFTFAKDLTIYVFIITFILITASIGEILCFQTYLKTGDVMKKQQAKFISIGWLIFLIPTIFTSLVLPIVSGGKPTPFFGTYGFAVTDLFMGYAISRYELFAVSPEKAAKNIISTMADSLVLMDIEAKVLSVNKAALDLLGYSEKDLIGKPAQVLFENKKIFPSYFAQRNWTVKYFETSLITKTGKTVPVVFSTSVIKDKSGNIVGIVGVGSNITERYIANNLQEALLRVPKTVKGINFGYLYRSATEAAKVGGDFYDIFELGNNEAGIVVGDISGKGIEAANLTSLVKNTVRAYSHLKESPAKVMERTNNVIREASSPGTFVTVFFGILDTSSGELTYCSAGHPMAMHKTDSSVTILQTSSTVIGVFPNQEYFNDYRHIDKGDSLIIYSDGVTEARIDGGFFGEEKLQNVISHIKTTPRKFPQAIYDKVMDYTKGKLVDDVVLLAVSLADREIERKAS